MTPIIFRIAEKLVVKRWLRPAIESSEKCDQLAISVTHHNGNTSSAFIICFHHVTRLRENNHNVHFFMIDFRKAFDTVDHTVLLEDLI